IQDLNPAWICRYKEEMVELIKTKHIKSILTPIQSGNERILKLMNRPMNLQEFKQTINHMKQLCPHLRVRTQVIVGFPTETEDEFEDTVAILKTCPFDEVDIFAYYEVGGSAAEKITPKVPPDIIVKRVKKLAKILTVPYRLSTNQDNLETNRKFRLFARPIKS
ncbi:MAG: radical SAM protein, partial [Candidatus Ratteibacteria bacterium]|nr:radical SAM protein [Candidatus Ratteibacteria bacterium]